jgi:hypothetical protein
MLKCCFYIFQLLTKFNFTSALLRLKCSIFSLQICSLLYYFQHRQFFHVAILSEWNGSTANEVALQHSKFSGYNGLTSYNLWLAQISSMKWNAKCLCPANSPCLLLWRRKFDSVFTCRVNVFCSFMDKIPNLCLAKVRYSVAIAFF